MSLGSCGSLGWFGESKELWEFRGGYIGCIGLWMIQGLGI